MPTDDYIKRSDAVAAMMTCRSLTGVAKLEAVNHIMPIPAADVEPVRHGRWSRYGEGALCSVCKKWVDSDISRDMEGDVIWPYYCPFCGAKMDEGVSNGEKL